MKRILMFRGKPVAEVESLPDAKAPAESAERITGVRRGTARAGVSGGAFKRYVASVKAARKAA